MTTTQTKSTIPTGVWKSDPVHSSVGFEVRHMVGTFRGSFGQFDAELSDASGEPELAGRVPVEAVRVDEENLYGHLLAPEFFDSAVNPEIRFDSTGISREDDQVVIEGELTVKGISKPVVARGKISGPVGDPTGAERVGIDLETKIDRHDFGLDWQMELPDGGNVLGDEVTLTVHLELVMEGRGSSDDARARDSATRSTSEEEPVS
jgi:polyisoprenoid-binding protein YceI